MNQLWYSRHPLRWILFPVAVMYGFIAGIRRFYLQRMKQTVFPVPVIVVGNLTVGGAGKTPLVIAIAKALLEKGIRVGIVSRGYGARGAFPREVNREDKAVDVGDEPLLIRKKTDCPVVIAPKRVEAVQYLLKHYQPHVIISDDGLQHYAMGRAVEIVVIDGSRGLGNGLIFPAGPLRERASRLNTVDFVVVNGGEWPGAYQMDMVVNEITMLIDGKVVQPTDLKQPVAAIAAIGHPERFYKTLNHLNVSFQSYSFSDHYAYKQSDLMFNEKHIVMTEKDAAKCLSFATDNMFVVSVSAELEQPFWDALWITIHQKLNIARSPVEAQRILGFE